MPGFVRLALLFAPIAAAAMPAQAELRPVAPSTGISQAIKDARATCTGRLDSAACARLQRVVLDSIARREMNTPGRSMGEVGNRQLDALIDSIG